MLTTGRPGPYNVVNAQLVATELNTLHKNVKHIEGISEFCNHILILALPRDAHRRETLKVKLKKEKQYRRDDVFCFGSGSYFACVILNSFPMASAWPQAVQGLETSSTLNLSTTRRVRF